jgi:hypothetical protein
MAEKARKGVTGELEQMAWLVHNRAKNQRLMLRVYELYVAHGDHLRKDHRAAMRGTDLVAVGFSLWRAVFLADRSGDLDARVDHTRAFLKRLVGDNAIAYPQDKEANSWSFGYYITAAGLRLDMMRAGQLDKSLKDHRDIWLDCHRRLSAAVKAWARDLAQSRQS